MHAALQGTAISVDAMRNVTNCAVRKRNLHMWGLNPGPFAWGHQCNKLNRAGCIAGDPCVATDDAWRILGVTHVAKYTHKQKLSETPRCVDNGQAMANKSAH